MIQGYQDDEFQAEEPSPNPKGSEVEPAEEGTTGESYKQSAYPKTIPNKRDEQKQLSQKNLKQRSKLQSLHKGQSAQNVHHLLKGQKGAVIGVNLKRRQHSVHNNLQGEATIGGKLKYSKSTFKIGQGKSKSILNKRGEKKYPNVSRLLKNSEKYVLQIRCKTELEKIEDTFHHSGTSLSALSVDEINRLNFKVREWIRGLNEELDLKIGEALRDRKSERVNKQKTPQEIVTLLEADILNNGNRIESLQREYLELQGQQYEYEEEQDHQIKMNEQNIKLRFVIREQCKSIARLKQNSTKSSGKLQIQIRQPKARLVMEPMKEQIIQTRTQIKTNESTLSLLQQKYVELSQLLRHRNQALLHKTRQAQQNNISLHSDALIDQYKQLKQKVDKIRTQRQYAQIKINRNESKIQQELKLMRNQIKHYERDTQQIEERISHISSEALSIIQRNKDSFSHNVSSVIFFGKYQSTNDNNFAPFSPKPTIEKENIQKQVRRLPFKIEQEQLQPINEEEETNLKPIDHNFTNEHEDNQFIDVKPAQGIELNREEREPEGNSTEVMKQEEPERPMLKIDNQSAVDAQLGEENKEEVSYFPKRFRSRRGLVKED